MRNVRKLKISETYNKLGNPISALGELKEALAHPDCKHLEAAITDSCGFDSCIPIIAYTYHKGVLILKVASHIPVRDKTANIHLKRSGLHLTKCNRETLTNLDLPDDTLLVVALQQNFSSRGLYKLIPVDRIGMTVFVGWDTPEDEDYEVSFYGGLSLDADVNPTTALILQEKLDA